MVLLRIPTAVHPMKGIEGFKYQASDLPRLKFETIWIWANLFEEVSPTMSVPEYTYYLFKQAHN